MAHGFARFGQRRSAFASFEMTLQIGIANSRFASGSERKGDAQNDESPTLGSVENAAAVGEAAGFAAEFANLPIFQVQYKRRFNRVGNFLSVSADVLHRSSAYASGNAAQALDSRALAPHRVRDEPVPRFAGTGVEENLAFVVGVIATVNARDRDF